MAMEWIKDEAIHQMYHKKMLHVWIQSNVFDLKNKNDWMNGQINQSINQ